MMIKLSRRLQTLADWVPDQFKIADIGSDHALLPCLLVQSGKVPYAIAGEINEGPFSSAQRQVRQAQLENRISVRKGDGLEVLAAGEVDAVIIAGMGGGTIADILESGRSKLTAVKRLILQPNVGGELVRKWLINNDWLLLDEQMIEEEGKIYEVIIAESALDAEKHNNRLLEAAEAYAGIALSRGLMLAMGPHLLQKPDRWFFQKWQAELDKRNKILRQMGRSNAEQTELRRKELTENIEEIKEVLQCLQKAKR